MNIIGKNKNQTHAFMLFDVSKEKMWVVIVDLLMTHAHKAPQGTGIWGLYEAIW